MANLPPASAFNDPTVTEAQFKAAMELLLNNVASIDWVNSNSKFKAVQIVSGNDFNNLVADGLYYHWGANISQANAPNAPLYISGNLANGTMIVKNANPANTKNTTVYQVFFPHADGYGPFIRKVAQGTTEFGSTWHQLLTTENLYTFSTALTTGQDVLTLANGRYSIPSIAVGDSLLNMPTSPYKFGSIEVSTTTLGYKSIRFTPYGRDSNFYINKSYESNVWSGWKKFTDYDAATAYYDSVYSTKTALSLSVAEALNNVTQDKYFGKQFTQSELSGSVLYSAAYYAGYNNVTSSAGANFNAIKARIFNPSGGEVQYRVYMGAKVSVQATGNLVLQANVNSPDYSGVCKSFPQTDTGSAQIATLDQVVSIPANTPFVIVFRATALNTLRLYHVSSASGNITNRGFNIVALANQWGDSNISLTSVPTYTSAGFQLLLKLPSSDPVPTPTYTPTLVLPPEIYSLESLESNIYLDNILVEKYTLYDFDFTCTKGIHKERGWRWLPISSDAPATYSMNVSVNDPYTTSSLASATTNIILVDKNANSGVTKKVQVIGDSLVAAGSITQGLLNNASSDVMSVNLIGSLGTSPNLHEGRGGWTINDYTTVGRTYYQFTVSGVVTPPAINSATYTYGGGTFTVQEVNLSGGSGTITCSLTGTAPTNGSSGTLTKSNASAGDATIAFSNVQSLSGNPFWNATSSSIDYQNYLTTKSLAAPDIVVIQLGINDTFSLSSDQAVIDFCATAFPNLNTLINSILAVNATIKVAVCAPPSYASQDAFGYNYQNGQTSRRAKRNITTYNKQLFAYFKDKKASRIYVISGGVNVDTMNNFPESSVAVNARNTKTTIEQSNGVHPAASGYYQEADAIFAFIKSL